MLEQRLCMGSALLDVQRPPQFGKPAPLGIFEGSCSGGAYPIHHTRVGSQIAGTKARITRSSVITKPCATQFLGPISNAR